MKLIFTTAAHSLAGDLDERFGRSPGFLLYDTSTDQCHYIDNQHNADAAQGAGIQAAQTVIASGAECLITGAVGPKALQVLASSGIDIFRAQSSPLQKVMAQYQSHELTSLNA